MTMNREEILALVSKVRTVKVNIPGTDAEFTLRSLTGSQRDALNEVAMKSGVFDHCAFRSLLLAKTIVDDNNGRQFRDEEAADIAEWDVMFLNPLFDAAVDLNGLGNKAVETAEKNS